MRRSLSLAVGALCLIGATDADAQLSRRRDRGAPGPTSGDRQILRYQGTDRTYVVRVPDSVRRGGAAVPLVIVLHGGGGNALNAERMTGFTAKGSAEGFIVVYPDGSARGRVPLRTWNAGHCCGYAMKEGVDDVGFVAALIDALERDYPIDAKRIYVTGMSNGAMMSHRLGIGLAHRIAAIAPVVGTLFGDERPPDAGVSAIILNGLLDQSVPYDGGAPGGTGARAWDGTPTRPAIDQATFWARANGCNTSPKRSESAKLSVVSYDCPRSLGVVFYTVKDGGHAWPGGARGSRRGAEPSTALDATDVIWDFFAAHPRR